MPSAAFHLKRQAAILNERHRHSLPFKELNVKLPQIREPRSSLNHNRAYAQFVEPEINRRGQLESIGTIFLTNRECPFHCTMCDLWKNTLRQTVPAGAIPRQIQTAIEELPPFTSIKLYNSGNFFDARAIPPNDLPTIANMVQRYSDCIVENHPKLVSQGCIEFAQQIAPAQLEVAIGLETCHEPSLQWLNKGMTLRDFATAVEFLHAAKIETRVFLLLGLPDMTAKASLEWTLRSIEFASRYGVKCYSIIPTRPTMPRVAELVEHGRFELPTAATIETVMDQAIAMGHGRVFIDLWDAPKFFACEHCRDARLERLNKMNLQQRILQKVQCDFCYDGAQR